MSSDFGPGFAASVGIALKSLLYQKVNTSTTIQSFKRIVEIDASSGNIIITLPLVNKKNKSHPLVLKRIDSSSNSVTINAGLNQFIDNSLLFINLNVQNDFCFLTSDGVSKSIIVSKKQADLIAATINNDGYLKKEDFSTFLNKQNNLGFTPENLTNKVNTFSLTPNNTNYPTEKLVKDNLDLKANLDSPNLTGIPTTPTALITSIDTQIANTQFVDDKINSTLASLDIGLYKGLIDASLNPDYPLAQAGYTYRISVAGKIGGINGINVEIGDLLFCITDTVAGDQITVGNNWTIIQVNIDGAVVSNETSTIDNAFVVFSGISGKAIKQIDLTTYKTLLSLTSNDVGLTNVSNDLQTKASVVPNNIPTIGQVLIGDNSKYVPKTINGDGVLDANGKLTVTKTNNVTFATSATTDATNLINDTIQGTFIPNNSSIVSSDNAKVAFEKTQGQLNNKVDKTTTIAPNSTFQINGGDLSANRTFDLNNFVKTSTSSGIFEGGIISQSTTTSITVTAGYGVNIDYTVPNNPVATQFTWNTQTASIITNNAINHVYITNAGVLSINLLAPSASNTVTQKYLGYIILNTAKTAIAHVVPKPQIQVNPVNQIRSLLRGFERNINTGVTIAPNGANMNINVIGGKVIGESINPSNFNDSLNRDIASATSFTFKIATSTGFTSDTATNLVPNAAQYDNGGVLTTNGGGNGTAINHRLYWVPDNTFVLQYGQNLKSGAAYGNLNTASSVALTEAFVVNPALLNAVLICVISVVKNATALNNTGQATFTNTTTGGITNSGSSSFTGSNHISVSGSVISSNGTTTPTANVLAARDNNAGLFASSFTPNIVQITNQTTNFTIPVATIDSADIIEISQTTPNILFTLANPTNTQRRIVVRASSTATASFDVIVTGNSIPATGAQRSRNLTYTSTSGWTDSIGGSVDSNYNINQTAHGFVVGNLITKTSTGWIKAIADSSSTAGAIGVVTTVSDANNFVYRDTGILNIFTGLTTGAEYFLSQVTPGAITSTAPIIGYYQSIGIAITPTSLLFLPKQFFNLNQSNNSLIFLSPLVPVMGAASNSVVTITDSGNAGAGYEAWRAFDNVMPNTSNNSNVQALTIVATTFFRLSFTSAYTVLAYECRTSYPLNRTATGWVLEGSNNGTTWTMVDTRTNVTWNGVSELKKFTVSKSAAYSNYRFTFTSGGDGTYIGLDAVQLYI